MPLMIGMMVTAFVGGTVIGGVSAAQQYCKQQAEAQQILQNTQKYIKTASATFDALEVDLQSAQNATNEIEDEITQSSATLSKMRSDYKSTLEKIQIGMALFIIIIFMLLLGKKLKIY